MPNCWLNFCIIDIRVYDSDIAKREGKRKERRRSKDKKKKKSFLKRKENRKSKMFFKLQYTRALLKKNTFWLLYLALNVFLHINQHVC